MKITITDQPRKPRNEFPYFARGTSSGRLALMLSSEKYIYLNGDKYVHTHAIGQVVERAWSKVEFEPIVGNITFTQE